jgi:small subunit ribosomal protein S17
MAETKPKRRTEMVGVVVSDKMNKTIKVVVASRVRHKQYGKFIKRSTKCIAHDEKNEAKVGDKVRIFQCRPLSKSKRWMLAEVVEKQSRPAEVQI